MGKLALVSAGKLAVRDGVHLFGSLAANCTTVCPEVLAWRCHPALARGALLLKGLVAPCAVLLGNPVHVQASQPEVTRSTDHCFAFC